MLQTHGCFPQSRSLSPYSMLQSPCRMLMSVQASLKLRMHKLIWWLGGRPWPRVHLAITILCHTTVVSFVALWLQGSAWVQTLDLGPFCEEFAFCPCACMAFIQALQMPPTVQRHANQTNWQLSVCGCEYEHVRLFVPICQLRD